MCDRNFDDRWLSGEIVIALHCDANITMNLKVTAGDISRTHLLRGEHWCKLSAVLAVTGSITWVSRYVRVISG